MTPGSTLTATLNPDFGQVEADPAVVNLSAFETFFAERRPFFVEGGGIFRFDINCNDDQCTGLFYSRRIGRAPQKELDIPDEDYAAVPAQTTILGAAKVTGRIGQFSFGALNARHPGGNRNDCPRGSTDERHGRAAHQLRRGSRAPRVSEPVVRRRDGDSHHPPHHAGRRGDPGRSLHGRRRLGLAPRAQPLAAGLLGGQRAPGHSRRPSTKYRPTACTRFSVPMPRRSTTTPHARRSAARPRSSVSARLPANAPASTASSP